MTIAVPDTARRDGSRTRHLNGLSVSSQTGKAPDGPGVCAEGDGGGLDSGGQRGEENGHLEGTRIL